MDKGFFVYRKTKGSILKEYWNRQDGKFVKTFTKACIYPTYKGANRQADSLVKEPFYFTQGSVIGVLGIVGI